MKLRRLAWAFTILLLAMKSVYAAHAIDLSDRTIDFLQPYFSQQKNFKTSAVTIQELSRIKDRNQTTHIRIQQQYAGFPVWGGDAIIHTGSKKVSMNGNFYENLPADLQNAPQYIFSSSQAQRALQQAIKDYERETGVQFQVWNPQTRLMVYLDEREIAHWAFEIQFKTSRIHSMLAHPVYVLDAVTFTVYEHWNNLKTRHDLVSAGGIGGNGNIGKVIYDGGVDHRPALPMERDSNTRMCYLRNETVIVKDSSKDNIIPSFHCELTDPQHNNVYWNTLDDQANGGYSIINDAIYSDHIVRQMYLDWLGVNMLEKRDKPMQVTFYVHDPREKDNAYYEDGEMVFGNGDDQSYPVVAPSVVAHEMSHGFTEQHSGLKYRGQPGGIDESFSDMADKAVEYYVYGNNNWEIDAELVKNGGHPLRFMDQPSKDCQYNEPDSECSIEHFKDYTKSTKVHFSSGIFNKAFYLMAKQWNTRQAFEVMAYANMNYWTSTATFSAAACGVLKAARDLKQDEKVVRDAMHEVGVEMSKCR